MKLCQIVSHVDEEASGPSYSVPRLCQSVASCGHEVVLATLDRGGGERDFGVVQHLAFRQTAFPKKLGLSAEMFRWLSRAHEEGIDLIHSHGLWMMPNMYPATVAERLGIPHVISPRGTLDPAALAYSKRLKQLVLLLGQDRALRQARALHATSDEEAAQFRRLGLKQPIIILPNGIDVPEPVRPQRLRRRTVLYLGRLHHKKGLDLLMRAWANLQMRFPDWELRIVGKGDEAFEAELKRDISALGLDRVRLDGPLYGAEKAQALKTADLFVLPTRGENFGMAVAEALAAGTPVITTRGAPWAGLEAHCCGWWTDCGTDAIGAALATALALMPDELEAMGERGRVWMETAFGWRRIGQAMSECYSWLINGGAMPTYILAD